jgi:predicted N-acetyltransferase YhbS
MIKLRPIVPGDFGAIAGVLMRAFLLHDSQVSLPRAVYLQLQAADCPVASWVAEEERRIVGVVFGHCRGSVGWIGPLSVSPKHQRRGLGHELCLAALHGLRQSGCTVIGLDSRADGDMVSFYQRVGFTSCLETVDGLKTISASVTSAENRLVFSNSPYGLFKEKWTELQKDLFPDFDYLSTIERLHHCGFGDGVLILEQGRAVAMAVVENGQRAVNDSPSVVRVMAVSSRAHLDWQESMTAVENFLHEHYPRGTHVYLRVREEEWKYLEPMGYQRFRAGRRWFFDRAVLTDKLHCWLWE